MALICSANTRQLYCSVASAIERRAICMSRWRATPLAKTLEADSGQPLATNNVLVTLHAAWAFLRRTR